MNGEGEGEGKGEGSVRKILMRRMVKREGIGWVDVVSADVLFLDPLWGWMGAVASCVYLIGEMVADVIARSCLGLGRSWQGFRGSGAGWHMSRSEGNEQYHQRFKILVGLPIPDVVVDSPTSIDATKGCYLYTKRQLRCISMAPSRCKW